MQDEITARPLVDILSEQLGEPVVMSGDNYVLMRDKSVVAAAAVELALATQEDNLLEQAKAEKIAEAKKYLSDTDFKMTVDYYATMTAEEQKALTEARAEARAFLIANGY